jgi:hypothetical protein
MDQASHDRLYEAHEHSGKQVKRLLEALYRWDSTLAVWNGPLVQCILIYRYFGSKIDFNPLLARFCGSFRVFGPSDSGYFQFQAIAFGFATVSKQRQVARLPTDCSKPTRSLIFANLNKGIRLRAGHHDFFYGRTWLVWLDSRLADSVWSIIHLGLVCKRANSYFFDLVVYFLFFSELNNALKRYYFKSLITVKLKYSVQIIFIRITDSFIKSIERVGSQNFWIKLDPISSDVSL